MGEDRNHEDYNGKIWYLQEDGTYHEYDVIDTNAAEEPVKKNVKLFS